MTYRFAAIVALISSGCVVVAQFDDVEQQAMVPIFPISGTGGTGLRSTTGGAGSGAIAGTGADAGIAMPSLSDPERYAMECENSDLTACMNMAKARSSI